MTFMTKDPKNWGKDHWSLLAYFEIRTVDHGGSVNLQHMRVNSEKRNFSNGVPTSGAKYGTIFKDGAVPDQEHDDIDVMEELESEGFIRNVGTLINPHITLTEHGRKTVARLREHKASGKTFSQFQI